MPLLLAILVFLAWPGRLVAQADSTSPGPLITDRPDRTESTGIVPRGFLQLEAGWSLEKAQEAGVAVHTHTVPGLLARIGVIGPLEARLGFSGFQFTNQAATSGASGLGDMDLGFKYRLATGRGWIPDVSLIGSVSVPTGSEGLSSGQVDPSVLVTVSRTLSDRVSVGSNLGSAWTTTDDGGGGRTTLLDLSYTLSFGFALSSRVGMFAETFGSVPARQTGAAAHYVDGGFTWALRDNLQMDVSGGRGVAGAGASEWFVGAGIAVRLPR